MSKLYAVLTGLIYGIAIGIIGGFVQANRLRIGDSVIPYGTVLVISFVAISQLWLSRHFQSRIAAITLAIGWAVATQIMGQDLSWNSAIIVDSWWSKIYVPAAAVIAGIMCALPPLRPIETNEELPEGFTEVMHRQDVPPTVNGDRVE